MIFSPLTVGHVGELVGADVELLGKDFPISRRLIEHIDEVRIFQYVGDFRACQKVLAVLRDAGGDAAPFSEPFPNLHAPTRQLAFQQK